MNAIEKRKQDWIEDASIETLERVVQNGPPAEPSTAERPLAGSVQIEGVGRIRMAAIKRELDRRRQVRADSAPATPKRTITEAAARANGLGGHQAVIDDLEVGDEYVLASGAKVFRRADASYVLTNADGSMGGAVRGPEWVLVNMMLAP